MATNETSLTSEGNQLMFARIYSRHLKHGDLKALAYSTGKSLEWTSRMTRIAGTNDPAGKFVEWYEHLFDQNDDCARALRAGVNTRLTEIESQSHRGKWDSREAAGALLHQASESIGALINTVSSDDEDALVALVAKVEEALQQCRASALKDTQPRLREAKR